LNPFSRLLLSVQLRLICVGDIALAPRFAGVGGGGVNVVALLTLEYPEFPALLKALTRYE
jgi:hypothetical protein